jgi:hypothetical protein
MKNETNNMKKNQLFNKTLLPAVKRKKDFVSFIALILFAVVIIFEIGIIYWLPSRLNSDKSWEKELALAECLELEDFLRAYLTTMRGKRKDIAGEIDLVKSCLDDYARYLRDNKYKMDREQTGQIYSSLLNFQKIYLEWQNDKQYLKPSDIDVLPFLEIQLSKL